VDLHVERTVPGGHADEAARRRVRRKIPRVDRIDGLEMRRVGAIHVALDDPVERRAGRRQAELHLLEPDLGLSCDRQGLDLAGGRIVRRDVRHEDEIAAPHDHGARDLAGFGIGGQRLDANGLSLHGGSSYLDRACLVRHDAGSKAVGCRFPIVRRLPNRPFLLTVQPERYSPPWSGTQIWSRAPRSSGIPPARPFWPPRWAVRLSPAANLPISPESRAPPRASTSSSSSRRGSSPSPSRGAIAI